MDVVDAGREHVAGIAAIYAAAARDTPATFDLEGLPDSEWHSKLDAGEEFLVAVEGGEVLGYAYSAPFRARPAYDVTREVSVYVAEAARGRGVGRALYAELLSRLEADPARNLAVAGMTLPNEASERLHRSFGFTEVGVFEGVGQKFGRSWDVRWYQRPLRPR
jgi:L-amino acid N-acyltransferase YncA